MPHRTLAPGVRDTSGTRPPALRAEESGPQRRPRLSTTQPHGREARASRAGPRGCTRPSWSSAPPAIAVGGPGRGWPVGPSPRTTPERCQAETEPQGCRSSRARCPGRAGPWPARGAFPGTRLSRRVRDTHQQRPRAGCSALTEARRSPLSPRLRSAPALQRTTSQHAGRAPPRGSFIRSS